MIDPAKRFVAQRLAAVRLHRWTESSDGSRTKYRKRGTEAFIVLGNCYLRIQGALSRCLRCREWVEWEVAVAKLLARDVRPLPNRTGLTFPRFNGVTLTELLKSSVPWEEKRAGLIFAGKALRQLHQQNLTACGVVDWPLSHGDATSCNVIVDSAESRANWIDFDMQHRIELPAPTRHADDLRALVWSSATAVAAAAYRDVISSICDGYAVTEIIGMMREQTRTTRAPTVFQLAQSPFNTGDFEELRTIVGCDYQAC